MSNIVFDLFSKFNLALPKGKAGKNGAVLLVGNGITYNSISDIANAANASLQVIETTTINLTNENILNQDGDELYIEGFWTGAGTGGNKLVNISIGGVNIVNSSSAFNSDFIWAKVVLKRITATTQTAFIRFESTTASFNFFINLTQNLNTGSLVIAWKQQADSGLAAELTSKFRTVYKYKR